MKSKGVQQSHASSWNSEATDLCGGMEWLFLLEHIVFFLLQSDVQTIIKLKLKQASNF